MEALAALSVVANIFQIVDFSIQVLSTANHLRQAGTSRDQSDISMIAEDLQNLHTKLSKSSQSLPTSNNSSEDQVALERLADRASAIAGELARLLDQHKAPLGSSRLKSLNQALRSTWDQKKIIQKACQLERIRNELSFCILASIRTDLDEVACRDLRNDDRLQKLDDATKKIVEAVLDHRIILKAELQVQSEELRSQLRTSVQDVFEDFDVKTTQRHDDILNAINFGRNDITDTSKLEKVYRLIQSNLNFHQLNDRYDDIKKAHFSTFQWIFTDIEDCSFANWVSSGRGIYWICGKAGSGKSTLMKMIDSDRRLRDGLRIWADGSPLVTASFFFWRNGTEIQRSYHGLLRSLLLRVIRAQPELSPVLFPHMYESRSNWVEFPTLHDLTRAFKTLIIQDLIPLKVAFLIDGLDEYESSDIAIDTLAAIFKDTAESPNVKIILSGRPIRVLEKAFECYNSLRLEHLTTQDISKYVNDKIRDHSDLAVVARNQPHLANELVAEVVQAASGVFLWVALVVKSLLEGFQNRDTIQILRERLREIPTDIYKLFQHMLRQLPARYRTQSAQIFQLHRAILEPLRSLDAQYISAEALDNVQFRVLTALGLSFALPLPENDLSFAGKVLSENEAIERVENIDVQLKTHCAGLLELRKRDRRRGRHPLDLPFDSPITYIHRTAADFLHEPHIWYQLTRGSESFPVLHQLFQSWVLQITRLSAFLHRSMDYYDSLLYREMLQWARLLDKCADKNTLDLLKRCHGVLKITFGSSPNYLPPSGLNGLYNQNFKRELSETHDNFLSFFVCARLKNALRTELKQQGGFMIRKKGRPLLNYACTTTTIGYEIFLELDIRIVHLLLAHGADPNETWSGLTPLQWLLEYCFFKETVGTSGVKVNTRLVKMLQMMIQYNANPNTYIAYQTIDGPVRYSALAVLNRMAAREVGEILTEIRVLIDLIEQRDGEDRHWIDVGSENWELQDENGEKAIWHDVQGNFVPKIINGEQQYGGAEKNASSNTIGGENSIGATRQEDLNGKNDVARNKDSKKGKEPRQNKEAKRSEKVKENDNENTKQKRIIKKLVTSFHRLKLRASKKISKA